MSRCESECQLLLSIFISVLSLSWSLMSLTTLTHAYHLPLLSLSLALPFPSKIPLLVSIPDSHVLQQWGMQPLPSVSCTSVVSQCVPPVIQCVGKHFIQSLLFPEVSSSYQLSLSHLVNSSYCAAQVCSSAGLSEIEEDIRRFTVLRSNYSLGSWLRH